MKHLTEYRDSQLIGQLLKMIAARVSQPWVLMEVCGGQTHSIVKYGLEQLLPAGIELLHGPGCPVCVTPASTIDQAISLARRPQVIFCSYGDMLRVPGSGHSLLEAKAAGADVRMVYSPLDALALARDNPDRQIVFFAIGFETTAPATAIALQTARAQQLANFSVLVAHFLVPPALASIATANSSRLQGLLAPGHVCAVTGMAEYQALAARYHLPIVITGFEPADILQGILQCVEQLERGQAYACNAYSRVVRDAGNSLAQEAVSTVFQTADQEWRGIGVIERSGLQLRAEYQQFDAGLTTASNAPAAREECISGDIMLGLKKPQQCPHFGTRCRPEHPLGAPMVSSEGVCAAYFQYH